MKLKSFILTIGLSLFALTGLLAQDKADKYEFATLRNHGAFILFTNSTKAESFKIEMKGNEVKFLEKLNELNEQGWEVYNVGPVSSTSSETCYLRKKKNQ